MDRRINSETTATDSASAAVGVDVRGARAGFSAWLRAEREARGISLDEIARVTKIQLRALERLEEARFDELPADVFVRGFIRNYARVVGLDAGAALVRYDDCGVTPGPAASARAKAMIETVLGGPGSDVASNAPRGVQSVQPVSPRRVAASSGPVQLKGVAPLVDVIAASVPVPEEMAAGSLQMPAQQVVEAPPVLVPVLVIEPPPVEAAPVVEQPAIEEPGKKKRGKGRKSTGKRKAKSTTLPVVAEAAPAVIVEEIVDPASEGMEITILVEDPIVDPMPQIEDLVAQADAAPEVIEPPRPVLVTPPRGLRLSRHTAPAPTLVIDDADPESAEREREARTKGDGKRSFLPSSLTRALLDNEKGGRGGLTLAVIILLIVATLTLSYLMRRPSSSGEGVTSVDAPSSETLV